MVIGMRSCLILKISPGTLQTGIFFRCDAISQGSSLDEMWKYAVYSYPARPTMQNFHEVLYACSYWFFYRRSVRKRSCWFVNIYDYTVMHDKHDHFRGVFRISTWGRESNGWRPQKGGVGRGYPIPSGEEVWELTMPPSRAGLSIVSVVPWEGAPVARGTRRSAAKFLLRCFDVWTFSVRLNATTTKKGRQLFGEKVHRQDKKILASRTRKGPRPNVGMGPPNG